MFRDKLTDYFYGVAAKHLSAVDAEPNKSNQHEIGGLPKAGFLPYLGVPKEGEKFSFNVRQVYITDSDTDPTICDSTVSWYDCRFKDPTRGPEYRLYYERSDVTERFRQGDFLLVAARKDGTLLLVCTPRESITERQLRLLFGLPLVKDRMSAGTLDVTSLLLPLRFLLEDLGVELHNVEEDDSEWLVRLVKRFGGIEFPTTKDFSDFARKSISLPSHTLSADELLMAWMTHEEKLFRIYERHIVQARLKHGFSDSGDGVDEFVKFSLSVQNRRKSRAGHAFEGHLDELFRLHKLEFEQGRGKGKVTENNARPDFIFPSFAHYHDETYPKEQLAMLGAKTSCKDRWRQVLSEADRISKKYLITLEPSITPAQTDEMRANGIRLVLPEALHITYTESQRTELLTVTDLIATLRSLALESLPISAGTISTGQDDLFATANK